MHPSATNRGTRGGCALVERCRAGDLAAFEEIYRLHSGKLYSLAFRMLGNATDAEDLLQEIFLSAHRKLDGFRGESALGTWLYRLAMNLCLDHLRSRAGRAIQVTDTIEDEPALSDARSRGLADQSGGENGPRTSAGETPGRCATAFVLHDVQGLEHREVGESWGSRKEPRSRRCTRRACGCARCCRADARRRVQVNS